MTTPTSETFTEHTQALAGILERFRGESLPLEDALALFEEGVGHIKAGQALLNQARGRFSTIQEMLATE
jgi:exodeoxyribonuclease VII small subunit